MRGEVGDYISLESKYSNYSFMSKRTSSRESSTLMSERKIVKSYETNNRLIIEKEKEERKENIIIKGIKIDSELLKERIDIFLRSKLGVETKVKTCRVSGKVIVVKFENVKRGYEK